MAKESTNHPFRLGLMATDPVRLAGLEAIFEQSNIEVVPITVPGSFRESDLSILIIDSQATEHLLVLLASLTRTHPGIRIVVLGQHNDPEYIQKVIGAGARGYLAYSASERDFQMAIDAVRDGSVWAPRKVLANLISHPSGGRPSSDPPEFTPREVQVLELLTAGRSNREIGLSLQIDESTVKAHVGRLMRKVGVANRISLTMYAMQHLFPISGRKK
ncbi:response regulator transcription factor [Terriglobus tenax]|uniref:response regulator transcription factor n=1 Tax=Terriglobus tenax TaxID=1111115 RepID=UPI0021E07BA3|nr:response regulator transcription factor [Terriglobus tenax]